MEREKEIDLERIKELNGDLYSDVIRLGNMFTRYATLIQRMVKVDDLKIDVANIIPVFFERENKYEFEDDGNTHTDGLEIQCGWILPVIGGSGHDFKEEYKYINLSALTDGMYLTDDHDSYVSLTYNAYIRIKDGRYRRCFTSLYYRKANFAFDFREIKKANRITYINDNYDKDTIFNDLHSCVNLCREITADYKKIEEYLEIVKLAKEEDINLYISRRY